MTKNRNIEQQLVQLGRDVAPGPSLKEAVLSRLESVPDSHTKPRCLWRRIMKNPLTKISTAAVFVLTTYLCLQIPQDLVAPAYALQDTIDAYRSIRTLHVKTFTSVYGQTWNSESWMECDEYGKPIRFRYQVDRLHTSGGLGPLILVNDGDGIDAWLPTLNLCFKRSGESVSGISLVRWEISDADPKLVCEKLHERARNGEIVLDVNEPDQKSKPIVLTVTYPAESRSVDWKKVLYVDQATRLVKKEEVFEKRDGQYQHERTTEFFDYNEQIEPFMFSLEGELPETARMIDQSHTEFGLAQGNMTDEEIAEEVSLQFFKAHKAKDFNKLGQLYLGAPAFLLEELTGGEENLKIISIGPSYRDPDPDSTVMVCPCTILSEEDGKFYEVDTKTKVAPVSGQPGRWMICGTTTYVNPASDEIIQAEYEPRTEEERTRGFTVVQGNRPGLHLRLKHLEVDLGRHECDLVPVRLVGLAELDAVSVRLSGPGAAFCTPWIEKEYQLHKGTQTPLGLGNPECIWLEVDSQGHNPGAYDLTVSLSSGQGTELNIPGSVTIHDVTLPKERATGMKAKACVVGLSWSANYTSEARTRLEAFLDDLAMLRTTVCDVFYTYNPANVLHQAKIAGTDQTLHAASQAGTIDINDLPDLDFSFFDPWIAGAAQRGMNRLEINGRLHLSEHELAFTQAVLGEEHIYSDETTWKTLMWFHNQFREYAISRGMTETWVRIDTQLTAEMIPDFVETASRYQAIGYRTYGNLSNLTGQTRWLKQLNAQNDAWYMGYDHAAHLYGQRQGFLDEEEQVWTIDNGRNSTPYEEGRRKAWRACAIDAHGYTWSTYFSDNPTDQFVWYDPET